MKGLTDYIRILAGKRKDLRVPDPQNERPFNFWKERREQGSTSFRLRKRKALALSFDTTLIYGMVPGQARPGGFHWQHAKTGQEILQLFEREQGSVFQALNVYPASKT